MRTKSGDTIKSESGGLLPAGRMNHPARMGLWQQVVSSRKRILVFGLYFGVAAFVIWWTLGGLWWHWHARHQDFYGRNAFMAFRWKAIYLTFLFLALVRIAVFLVRWFFPNLAVAALTTIERILDVHHIPSLALLLFKPYDAVHDTSFATATTAGEDAESIHRSPQDESAGGGLPRGPDPTLVVEPKRSFALEWELRKKPRRSNSLDPNFAPGQAFVIAELPTTAPTAPRKGAPTMPVLLAEWRARRGQVPAALQCTRNVPPVDRIQPLFTDIAFIPKQHLLRRALSESDIQSAKPPFNGHIGRLDSPDVTHAEMAVRLRGFHHSTLRYFLERPTTLCTMYTRTAQWLAQSEEKNTELQIQCDSLRQKCYSQKRFTAKQPIWILVRVRKVLEDTDEAASSLLTDFQYRSTQDKVSLSCLAPPGTTPAVSSAPTVFEIDHYFGSSSTNREVYREVEPLMDIVFHGNDVCIFADGQSGSGKSWTMFKGANALAPSIAESIMTWKDTDAVEGWKREVQCSAIEVHMDKLKDLLAPKGTEHFDIAKAKRGLYDRPAVCVEALLDLFKRAHSRLEVKGTHENRESSRGHFICSLVLTQSHPERPSVKSRITMIDLAGSERTVHPSRIAETHNRSSTAESVFINSSRTALRVFLKAHRNLGLGSVVSEFIKYLKIILTNNPRLIYLAHLSPHAHHYGRTLDTLKFTKELR